MPRTPEERRAYFLAWQRADRLAHPEKYRRYRKQGYHKDLEKSRARSRADAKRFRARHPEARKAYEAAQKEAIAANNKAYRAAHREHLNAKRRENARKHPEKLRTERQLYYQRHKERRLKEQKAYRQEHAEQLKQRYRTYYLKHMDILKQKIRAYNKAHPEKGQHLRQQRYAREKGAAISDFTPEQWRILQEVFDHRCAYCGRRAKGKLTRDHITAYKNKGNNTLHNIVPACRSCNSSKQAGPVLKPVQPLLL